MHNQNHPGEAYQTKTRYSTAEPSVKHASPDTKCTGAPDHNVTSPSNAAVPSNSAAPLASKPPPINPLYPDTIDACWYHIHHIYTCMWALRCAQRQMAVHTTDRELELLQDVMQLVSAYEQLMRSGGTAKPKPALLQMLKKYNQYALRLPPFAPSVTKTDTQPTMGPDALQGLHLPQLAQPPQSTQPPPRSAPPAMSMPPVPMPMSIPPIPPIPPIPISIPSTDNLYNSCFFSEETVGHVNKNSACEPMWDAMSVDGHGYMNPNTNANSGASMYLDGQGYMNTNANAANRAHPSDSNFA